MTGTMVRPGPGAPRPPLQPWWRRRPWQVGIAAAVVAVLVLLGLWLIPGSSGRSPRSTAPPSAPSAAAPAPSGGAYSGSYAVDCLAVGAAVPGPGVTDQQFRSTTVDLGPLTIRRSFSASLPRSFQSSPAGSDQAAGLHSFVSWKPPDGDAQGTADGRYDQQIAAWARSVPGTGVFATVWHEPEGDLSAADYVAMERHVYTVVKRANPSIRFGPVYMAYWWDPSRTDHYVGDPAAWWPGGGYADFAGLDWYGRSPTPMTSSASFRTWYGTMAPTGKPLVIAEYGQYFVRTDQTPQPAKEQARAAAITQDAAWLFAHPEFKAWLYWDGGDASGSWALTDQASQQAWQAVAARGCH